MSGPSATKKHGFRVRPSQKARFLRELAEARTVKEAAAAAGIHWRTAYRLKERDDAFAKAWEEAYQAGADVVRAEIRRRAIEGWREPVFQGGELVGHVRKYSDRLLELEAKRRDPAYREKQQLEIGGTVRGEVTVKHDYDAILDGLEQMGLIRRGEAAAVDAAAARGAERPALLPARTDDSAD